jgi:hypothetical protein
MCLKYSSQIALLHEMYSVESYNLLRHGMEENLLHIRPCLKLMNASMYMHLLMWVC